jgi:DNA topoisomerase VI subunit A
MHIFSLQVSSSRGLVFGALAFRVNEEEWISASKAAIVMPSATHSMEMDCQADAIYVVEKECVFRRMLDGE